MKRGIGEEAERDVLSYIKDAQPIHDEIRRVLTQLSGLALSVMLSPQGSVLLEATRGRALEAARQAEEAARALAVPATAAHHHHHLSAAATTTIATCRAVADCAARDATERDRDRLVALLKQALRHLRVLSRLLPGFEPVSFGQACCAAHARPGADNDRSLGGTDDAILDLGARIRRR